MSQDPVIIVGAGLAGSAAALSARRAGAPVVLLDLAEDPTTGGNTALSGGGLHIGPRVDPERGAAAIRAAIVARTGGRARPELVEALSTGAPPALEWLIDHGVRVRRGDGADGYPRLLPARDLGDLHAWPGRGPHAALEVLQTALRARGGVVRGGVRVRELVAGGVVTEAGERIAARAVVLCDGGFQCNPTLLRRHVGPAADALFLRGAGNGHGDALLMGEAAGAQLAHTEWFYGHCMHADAASNDRLWPWPGLDEVLAYGGILVNHDGRRICDEALGGVHVANIAGRSARPDSVVIISEELWDAARGKEVSGHLATNPELLERGARVYRAEDASRLGEVIGVDSVALSETVREFSAAAVDGVADRLAVPRADGPRPLTGALMAIPMIPGITHTMGGLLVDGRGAVLGRDGTPLPGLFAAGPTASVLNGGANAAYVGGLLTALVMGIAAGHSASAL